MSLRALSLASSLWLAFAPPPADPSAPSPAPSLPNNASAFQCPKAPSAPSTSPPASASCSTKAAAKWEATFFRFLTDNSKEDTGKPSQYCVHHQCRDEVFLEIQD